jgi:hypothetical protein
LVLERPRGYDRRMRRLAGALVVTVVAACGGGAPNEPPVAAVQFSSPISSSPENVVLGWSDALNHGLNENAAGYFAPETTVVAEDGRVRVLHGRAEVVAFNASIACQGRIIGLSRRHYRVWAAFILDQRGTFACPAPGALDTARFTVEGGRIVRFEDLPD